MDIKTLRNYIEIVDSGSITAAAKKLFIAQPALSNQLKSLERELGTQLIDRGPHHQEITYSGKLFYDRAKHIIELENGIKRDISKYENRQYGSLRIGVTPYTAVTFFDGILTKFFRMNPDIRYELYEYDSGKLVELIDNRVIDAAIVRTPCRMPKNGEVTFLEEDRWVVVYSDELGGFEEDEIYLENLGDVPITLIRRHEDIFVKACEEAEYMPNIKFVTVQLSTVFELAKSSLAVGVVPFSSVDYIKKAGLKYKTIKNSIMPIRRAIITSGDSDVPVICSDFVEFCKNELRI